METTMLRKAFKEASLTTLLVGLLTSLIIGFRTEQGLTTGLELQARPKLWLGTLAVTFGLRFLHTVWLAKSSEKKAQKKAQKRRWPLSQDHLPALLLAFAALVPVALIFSSPSLQSVRYEVDLGILILTYIMLGWGLNIVVGLAGLLDLGYVAFYAVGAYTCALLSQHFGLSFWICLPLAGVLAAFWGILLGFPVLRLRGDYLAIVTLAFGEIIRLVLINWDQVTGGPAGLLSIPRPSFFGLPFNSEPNGFASTFGLSFDPMHRIVFLYYVILVLALITFLVSLRLRRLPLGRAWEALREDEIACRALGLDTTLIKLSAFAIGAMFGGFAGAFFAARQGYINPNNFEFMESAMILAIVVLGGMGSTIGVALAAVVLIGGMELLRNLTFLKVIFGDHFDPSEYRLLLFGVCMVLMMLWRPRGFMGHREPTATLHGKTRIEGSFTKEGHG